MKRLNVGFLIDTERPLAHFSYGGGGIVGRGQDDGGRFTFFCCCLMGLHINFRSFNRRRILFASWRHLFWRGRGIIRSKRCSSCWGLHGSVCSTKIDSPLPKTFSKVCSRGTFIINMTICIVLSGTRGGARQWRYFNEHRRLAGYHA